jgi:hypothetical protein
MDVDGLVRDLTKPLFVFRMARAKEQNPGRLGKGARTTVAKARQEIEDVVFRYVTEEEWLEKGTKEFP